MEFEETIAEGSRKHLPTSVQAGRVLCGKEHEVFMGSNHLLSFRDEKLAIIIEESVERF